MSGSKNPAGAHASSASADELRREFDRLFALPPRLASAELEDLLGLRIANVSYALAFREMAGMIGLRQIRPVPGQAREMLGLAGVRGAIVPIYALARLLGHEEPSASPRWIVLCARAGETNEAGHGALIGLAFDELEGHLRVARAELRAAEPAAKTKHAQHLRHLVRQGGAVRAVISIPSLFESISGIKFASQALQER